MAKKRVYWFIQQLTRFGGTETVSLNLVSLLKNKYDVTVVVSSKDEGKSLYSIPAGVNVIYLGMSDRFIKVDDYIEKYKSQKRFLAVFGSVLYVLLYLIFARPHGRRKIKKMTQDGDTLIASSLDSYLLMPRGRKVFYHYHFNDRSLFSPLEKIFRLVMRKPDQWIFITQETCLKASAKKAFKGRCSFVYNPIKIPFDDDFSFKGGRLIFIGRLNEQKRPLLLLNIASKLKEQDVAFHLDVYGEGPLQGAMEKQISASGLESLVSLRGPLLDTAAALDESDLLLLPSKFEGWGLVIGEANARSVPVISSAWGSGVSEAMKDGVNGYVISSDDPLDYSSTIQDLLTNQSKLEGLKKTSYEFATRLSSETILENWEALIESK